MYTGKLAPQLIDPARLEQGVKFLHAYPLIQEASLNSHVTLSHPEPNLRLANSLYGIQISDQQGAHGRPAPDSDTTASSEGRSRLLTPEMDVEASTSNSQVGVREASEGDVVPPEIQSGSTSGGSSNTILHVKPSIMKRNSFRKHYTCRVCGSRFNQRAALREHLLWHGQAMAPLLMESGMVSAPLLPGGAAAPEADEVLTAATPVTLDGDSEQPLPNAKGSPRSETQPQADTPPPSDIADIDNLEGAADIEREVKRRKYECHTCGRKFIQKSHWREHMYIHTGKPYRCSACGKSFCRANQAARHVCVGQGAESAYTMVDRHSMELCAADDSSQMEALFFGPSGRPYKCNVCEMTLTTPDEVLKHLCFNQGSISDASGSETAKQDGSDSPGHHELVTAIKTEEVLEE